MKKEKKIKLVKDKPYEVEWVDTFTYSGWYTEEEIEKRTNSSCNLFIGYLVKETPDFIILAGGKETKNKDFAPYHTPSWIPKGYIKSIKKL